MRRRLITLAVAVLALAVAGALSAAPKKLFDNAELRIRFEWPSAIRTVAGDKDVALEGEAQGIAIKAVVRKGERIAEEQHQFRLMSYFAGAWEQDMDDCRGTGWERCTAWHFESESGKTAGVAEVGFGPGGTYLIVLSSEKGPFKSLRPRMRAVQQSIVLY